MTVSLDRLMILILKDGLIFGKKEEDELKESYEQSKRNRAERKNDE